MGQGSSLLRAVRQQSSPRPDKRLSYRNSPIEIHGPCFETLAFPAPQHEEYSLNIKLFPHAEEAQRAVSKRGPWISISEFRYEGAAASDDRQRRRRQAAKNPKRSGRTSGDLKTRINDNEY